MGLGLQPLDCKACIQTREGHGLVQSSPGCLRLLTENTAALDTSLFLSSPHPRRTQFPKYLTPSFLLQLLSPGLPQDHFFCPNSAWSHSTVDYTTVDPGVGTAGAPAEMCKCTTDYSQWRVCYSDSCPSPSPTAGDG